MRRKDREITDYKDLISLLEKNEVIRIGLCDGGRPYIVPMNFGTIVNGENVAIYLHSAREGRKIEILQKSHEVCFELDTSFRAVKGKMACAWTGEYESIIGEGSIEILEDPAEKRAGMDAILHHYGYEGTPDYGPAGLERTALLKITVRSMTGKRHLSPK